MVMSSSSCESMTSTIVTEAMSARDLIAPKVTGGYETSKSRYGVPELVASSW